MQKIIRITKEKILKLYCIKKEMLRFNCYGLTPREQRPQYKKPTQTNRSDTYVITHRWMLSHLPTINTVTGC